MHPSPPADDATVITPTLLRGWPIPLPQQGDKHVRGTVLVIGGSTGTPGAALLAGIGALRAGAGRLQIATSETIAGQLAVAVPEALVVGVPEIGGALDVDAVLTSLEHRLSDAHCVLLGPGLAATRAMPLLVEGVLGQAGPHSVVVLDAQALHGVKDVRSGCLVAAGDRVVATPNQSEARAVVHDLADDSTPAEQAAAVARRLGGVATVHGEVVCADGRRWSAGTGTIGLGTSGSGDVLAGVVAGVAARGGDAAQAACWGTYLHATAGDRLAATVGPVGYLARELLDEVPQVLAELTR